MRKYISVVIIILLGGLSLYSQCYSPVTFIADDEDRVWGNVHVGDIIEFQQPNLTISEAQTKKGIVFYVNPEKTEGWAVETENTSNSVRWNSSSNLIDIPTFSTAQVGSLLSDVDGYNNTSIIRQYYGLAPGAVGNFAAGQVDFKNRWYLPAAGQLMKLYGVLPLLEECVPASDFTTLNRGTGTSNARYWTSTQSSTAQAWYVQGWINASSGGNFFSIGKTITMSVRAVRTFKMQPRKLSYLWSPTGDTIPNIMVAPNETTEYCVTVRYGDLQCVAEACQTVTVRPTKETDYYLTVEDRDLPFEWDGIVFTEAGTQTFAIPLVSTGCDSIVHLHLTVDYTGCIDTTLVEVSECESYEWYGETYTKSGIYYHLDGFNAEGCEHYEAIDLTINHGDTVWTDVMACDYYDWYGEILTESGVYYHLNGTTADGCEHYEALYLTIGITLLGDYYTTICESQLPYTWQGVTFNDAGSVTFTHEGVAPNGCDSIVTLHLTVNPSDEMYDMVTLCQGESYTWQGYSFGAYAGVFEATETLQSLQGCDSIVHMTVTVYPRYEVEERYIICESELPYNLNGWIIEEPGTYAITDTYQSYYFGCDSIVTLTLTVNPLAEGDYYTMIDASQLPYTWHGVTFNEEGEQTITIDGASPWGCDSIVTLHLTVNESITNHWTPIGEGSNPFSMTLYGVIAIDGVEQTNNQLELGVFCGNECRGTAMVSEFFLTHRYLAEVNVYGDSGQELTFKLYDHATHQELDLTPPEAITFTIDGYGNPVNPYVLNFTSSVSITAMTDPEGAGTVTGTGEYIMGATCTLTATANTGFQFQNWTLNGTVVSTNPSYTFTVTGAANYVVHFQYVQSRTLVLGWNWWSTYIEQEGSNGLEMLENSLGTSGIRIQGRNASADCFEYQGTSYWSGALNAIENEQMYMIRTNAACDAVIVGDAALPANHPITINGGWNWIGYPCSQNVDVNVAMNGFTPEANDVIKGRNNVSTYISYGDYQGWYGQLNTLEPGQGYMYKSYSTNPKTLTFQTGRGEETLANITSDNNVFVPNTANYADNMIVTAVIDIDGEELRSEDYELAAFVGNECRGSVKLMYVEPLDRYVAMLMAYGEGEEELRFVLTDGNGTSWSNDRMTYVANGTVGTMTEPEVLHFGLLGIEDNNNIQKPVSVYPNPSNGVFNVEGEGVRKIEVIDMYGQIILSKEVKTSNIQVNLGDKAAGAYLLRVVTDSGIATHKLVKNN